MIERYSRKQMKSIWSEKAKFDAFLEVEKANCIALNKLNVISSNELNKILNNASFDLDRIKELELETKHDVIAFTRAVSESLGEEKRWIHFGLTSTDVVDTANAILIKKANDIIREDITKFIDVLKEKALMYENTPCIGRTHGMHADITSFGLKFALWYSDMIRNLERFDFVRKEIEVGKLSGAVGNFSNVNPKVEEFVTSHLGIYNAKISTQVIQRDRHASYLSVLALIASTVEKMAVEIRSLQRTEIKEVEEAFTKGQKGSSAMPHKRNPISSENVCGCARVIRGYMISAFEDVPLWHERDISHSSVERIILPDATILLDYMLNRFTGIIKNLVVYKDNMLNNIYKTNGVVFSQRVLNKLIEHNTSREEAYDLIQSISMNSLESNTDFKKLLENNEIIKQKLTEEELESCFTLDYYFKQVPYIYKRLNLK